MLTTGRSLNSRRKERSVEFRLQWDKLKAERSLSRRISGEVWTIGTLELFQTQFVRHTARKCDIENVSNFRMDKLRSTLPLTMSEKTWSDYF